MPTEIVSSLIVTNIKGCLKTKGYKQFKCVWNRKVNAFTHVLEIQDMRGANADTASFTINFGVFVPDVLEMVWGKTDPKCVKDVDCVIAERIGRLMPGGLDKWWRVDPAVNLEAVLREVIDAINTYSEQFFDKVRTLEGIRAYMIEQKDDTNPYKLRGIYLAVIEWMLGNEVRSKTLIDSLIEDKVWGERAKRVNRYLTSLSLLAEGESAKS